ncbi:MAG: hypothetical protein IMF26_01335 [Candidatus Fermentithermobacillus carboniphilus]|uniref:Uncharacterized protein n=1 Tax=Candidatus Fermentithermobacillus carboniphilus TaxID=3085328 RepID=A0AAT9LCD3_9FIRM|nr:MAG: hypothetical protein IMF26_01335 [Candidatus Fermentithermobacillus carboniphilus]
MDKKPFTERDLPEIHINLGGAEAVNQFYRELGWTPGTRYDPARIRMNPVDFDSYCLKLSLLADKEQRSCALILWLYCGPAKDPKVPVGKIRLYKDCFIRSETTDAAGTA